MEAIDHVDLVVSSLERGERVVYLSRHGGGGSVSLRERQSDAHEVPYDRYAIGVHHIAFSASSRTRCFSTIPTGSSWRSCTAPPSATSCAACRSSRRG